MRVVASEERYHTLDGLRGIAAILVAIYHLGIWEPAFHFVPSGYIAVDYFFALSGFVIAINYEARLRGQMSFAIFARTRVIRLFPLYLLGFGLGLAVILARIHVGAIEMSHQDLIAASVFGLVMLPTPSLPAAHIVMFPFNDPAWSLFVELIVNFGFALLLVRLRTIWLVLVLALTAAYLVMVIGPPFFLNVGWKWGNLVPGIARATFGFTVGMLAYRAGWFRVRYVSWAMLIRSSHLPHC